MSSFDVGSKESSLRSGFGRKIPTFLSRRAGQERGPESRSILPAACFLGIPQPFQPHSLNRLRTGGVFVFYFQRAINCYGLIWNLSESDATNVPVPRLKSTSANSCVPDCKPLGYVDYYAPKWFAVCALRFITSQFFETTGSSSVLDG